MTRELGEGLIVVQVNIDKDGERLYDIETYEGESCDFMAEGPDFEDFLDHLEFPGNGLYEVSGITVLYHPPDGPFGEADHDIEGGVVKRLPDEEIGP